MSIEDQLRERLKKVEALLFWRDHGRRTRRGGGGAGAAEGEARRGRPERSADQNEVHGAGPMVVRLFIALCRRYGLKPYRYPRQRRTTIMVKAPRHFLETVLWRQFCELHDDLSLYLEQTTERVIRERRPRRYDGRQTWRTSQPALSNAASSPLKA